MSFLSDFFICIKNLGMVNTIPNKTMQIKNPLVVSQRIELGVEHSNG
jgi:hypothetical protein